MESFLFFSQNLSSDRKDFVLDGKEGASGRISSGLKVARSTIPDSVRVRVCVCTRACNVTIHLCIHYGPMGERIRREKGVKKRNVPFQGTRPQFPCTRPEIRPRHISARPATRNQRRDSIRRILAEKSVIGWPTQWGCRPRPGFPRNSSFANFLFRPPPEPEPGRDVEYTLGGNCLPRVPKYLFEEFSKEITPSFILSPSGYLGR